jgi:hypothetical protein
MKRERVAMKDQNREPQGYEAPVVIDYGDLNDLTGGSNDGYSLDADFPVHTKKSELTFS